MRKGMYRVYSGQQLLTSCEIEDHAMAFARDREYETGFRIGGTYNRIRFEMVEWAWAW